MLKSEIDEYGTPRTLSPTKKRYRHHADRTSVGRCLNDTTVGDGALDVPYFFEIVFAVRIISYFSSQ